MDDLENLYQELILDHTRNPRNRRKIDSASGKAEGYNPLCGDRVTLYVSLKDDVIGDVSFEGSGCAISTASASLLTEVLKGKTSKEAEKIFGIFHAMLTGSEETRGDNSILGKLEVFEGVRRFPMRVKCATLSWHTLKAALEKREEPVSTEGIED